MVVLRRVHVPEVSGVGPPLLRGEPDAVVESEARVELPKFDRAGLRCPADLEEPVGDLLHDADEADVVGESTDLDLEDVPAVGLDAATTLLERPGGPVRGNVLEGCSLANRHVGEEARAV